MRELKPKYSEAHNMRRYFHEPFSDFDLHWFCFGDSDVVVVVFDDAADDDDSAAANDDDDDDDDDNNDDNNVR